MKILVTGGAGFIGSHIIDHALRAGHEVAALDDLSSGRRDNLPQGVHLYEVDVRNKEATRRAVLDFSPEAVSHQAAQASVSVSMKDPALDAAVNVVGGIHVADACREARVERLVFASTGGAIYGNVAEGAAREGDPTLPISPYAIHKLAFEQLLSVYREAGALETKILRYANVFGPRQDPHGEAGVVAIFLNRMLRGLPLQINAMRSKGDAGCIRDYVFVSDVARANLRALEGNLEPDLMNVGTGVGTSTRTLAETLLPLLSTSSELSQGDPRAGDVERSVLDGSVFQKHLGGFVGLAPGLAETAQWYQEHRAGEN